MSRKPSRRQRGREVSGILLLNKPLEETSNGALQRVKRLYNAKKAGHTGSLDPLASGMLPICFGEATKFSQFLLESDKTYEVTARLGIATTTGDAEGEILATLEPPKLEIKTLEETLQDFRGLITQIPSMFSAIKHNGEPLYKLARRGIEVERPSREVTIYELILKEYTGETVSLDVHCSKGTYIRTLVEDLGKALGCGAHVAKLHRSNAGPYKGQKMYSHEELEAILEQDGVPGLDACLLPMETAVAVWPYLQLSSQTGYYLRQGQAVLVPKAPTEGWVRLYNQDECFLGVGEIQDDGRVAPRRLLDTKTLVSRGLREYNSPSNELNNEQQ